MVLGLAHVLAALLLGLAQAVAPVLPAQTHALVGAMGLTLAALGLSLPLAPALLQRDVGSAGVATGILLFTLLADAAGVLFLALDRDPRDILQMGYAFALAWTLLAILHARVRGEPSGADVYAAGEPFRKGDMVSAAYHGVALAGLAAAALLLAFPPRDLPTAGLAVLVLGALVPLAAGALLFLLPRAARQPLPGATLLLAALVFHALATGAFAFAFARPVGASFTLPAAVLLLADALALTALLRFRYAPATLARERSLLQAALALAPLATLALLLGVLGDEPNALLPMALYAHLALALVLVTLLAPLAAPLVLRAPHALGRRARWGAVLLILGLFLLAPAFQYPRPSLPGAALSVLGAALLVSAAWPAKTPS